MGRDALPVGNGEAGHLPVLLAEHIEREMDAVQLASFCRQVARDARSDGDAQRVVPFEQFRDFGTAAHGAVRPEPDALGPHEFQPAVDDPFVQLEVGYAEPEQAAGCFVFLEYGDGVAAPVELVGAGQSGGARTDHRHLLPRPAAGRAGNDVSGLKGLLDDGRFVFADRDGLIVELQHARLLAERRADPAGEFGKVVGQREDVVGLFPFSLPCHVLPFGLAVAQRTGPVAERDAAVHAARSLQLAVFRVERLFYRCEIVYAFVQGAVTGLLARYV